jgi:hypothetical protein
MNDARGRQNEQALPLRVRRTTRTLSSGATDNAVHGSCRKQLVTFCGACTPLFKA